MDKTHTTTKAVAQRWQAHLAMAQKIQTPVLPQPISMENVQQHILARAQPRPRQLASLHLH